MITALLLNLLLASSTLSIKSCPQIDIENVDNDGMPLCPKLGENSAWDVYSCAINQGRAFHAPSDQDRSAMTNLLTTFKESTVNGIGRRTTNRLLAYGNELNLQACRVIQDKNGERDSFLLFYVRPGFKNYSGPFMMLRETKHSKVLIIGPHDDTDQTYAVTKIGTRDTFALGTISNGHQRRNIPKVPPTPGGKRGDFVHEDEQDNLGTFAIQQLGKLFNDYVVLHFHGQSQHWVLYKCADHRVNPIFEKIFTSLTGLKKFERLNVHFSIDSLVNTKTYLKTEIPVISYTRNKQLIADIVTAIEEEPWAW